VRAGRRRGAPPVADRARDGAGSGEGQKTKVELVYQYLTGPRFRQRVEAIIEKISDMQADLDRERKAMTRLWAKREAQIRGVVESTVGMYGDLQGIAGRSLQESTGSIWNCWTARTPRSHPTTRTRCERAPRMRVATRPRFRG
jgi:hypothetical protein